MATHADVAQRFAQYLTVPPAVFPKNSRALRGSRMHTSCTFPPSSDLSLPGNKLFQAVAYGFSYDTCIARLVLNVHTQAPELWLSERRYSQSTDRHRGMYRAAYIRHCSSLNIKPSVFMFTQDSPQNRHDPGRGKTAIMQFATYMTHAARRGAHTATRELFLTNARATINVALRHMTQDIPESITAQQPHAEVIATLTGYLSTIETMLASPETIKAAALGWLALNDIAPPTY